MRGDITDDNDAQRIVTETVARFGHIDIVVNCAGIGPYRALGAMDAAFVRSVLDTNVLGTVLVTQAALPHLTAPGGRIINFSSALAFRPIPTSSVYSASKAAVITLTHAWSKELGPRGITVNAIAPGVIETEMTATILAARGTNIIAVTPLVASARPTISPASRFSCAPPRLAGSQGRPLSPTGGLHRG